MCGWAERTTCDLNTHFLPNTFSQTLTDSAFATEYDHHWRCEESGECPLEDYGIWLKYSAHGIGRFTRDLSDVLDDPLRNLSELNGGLSYGQASEGNRPYMNERVNPVNQAVFSYIGEAVGLNNTGSSPVYGKGNFRINIRRAEAVSIGQPVELIIHIAGAPQWHWKYDLGIHLLNGVFHYEVRPIQAGGVPGPSTDYLVGRYYGPNHEEFGGVFFRDDWSGAYGGTKLH